MSILKIIGRGLAYVLIAPVRFYQLVLSPLLPRTCRYHPSCSNYMIQALKKRGPVVGLWLGLRRIARCHPWGGHGYDPVPDKPSKQHHHHDLTSKKKSKL